MSMNIELSQKKQTFKRRLISLLFVLFLVIGGISAQSKKISLRVDNVSLKEALEVFKAQSGYSIWFETKDLNLKKEVSLMLTDVSIQEALNELLKDESVKYEIKGKTIYFEKLEKMEDVQIVVKGRVVDFADQSPLISCNIHIKNRPDLVTVTDIDGNYSIQASKNDILVFSYIGYDNLEEPIKGRTVVNVKLSDNYVQLKNVVVTGYQTLSKERATGSFSIVGAGDIQNKLQTNIMNRMEGLVAGLNINRGVVNVRGVSTINGNKAPLYVVDGVPFEGEPGINVSPLDVINPSEVVNITVLKDATAASIYGARSANGVIVITTRKGITGPTRVTYNGSLSFTGLPDRDYLNLMSSSELVDYQLQLMETYPKVKRKNIRQWQNDVQSLILDHKEGKITSEQLTERLLPYRSRDRYDQVVNEFLRKNRILHQHNLSFGGGSDIYKYSFSTNYTGTAPYERVQYEHRIGINLQSVFDFFKWLRFDVGVIASKVTSDYNNGVLGMDFLNSGGSSYFMFRDDKGVPLQWYGRKSQHEIDRLNALGLQDETYIPVNELNTRHFSSKKNYTNYNIGAKIKFNDDFNLSLRYQTESTSGFEKQYDSKDAIIVKTMINDATQINGGIPVYNIPLGGQIVMRNIDNYSYTLRGQANYSKNISVRDAVQALIGVEVRKIVSSGNGIYRLGYDDDNLGYSEINALSLSKRITGTEALYGGFSFKNKTPKFSFIDNRYFSLYGNASYSLFDKLSFTGSIRIDQSNLFGTDPKYQYRPLWSIGTHYVFLQNQGWIDRLMMRATYGINGNIPKLNGPYLIAKVGRNNYFTNENTMYIQSPPNPTLRWEKTNVFNMGVDFNLFNARLNGSVDFYNKNTTDLLGLFSIDPTLGWSSVNMNFGNMYNRGVEISLNSVNFENKKIRWTSRFIFSYNKNKITKIESSSESASSYYFDLNNRKGYPMNSLFSVRYKGLNEKGYPVAYKADGSETSDYDELTKEDLVHSGTYDPPYHASLTNTISYKGFDFSFMFVYAGGHVMRDVAAGYCITYHPMYLTNNTDRNMINYWKKPGDEILEHINPAFMFQSAARNGEYIWKAADKHIQKGDYIKLRDVSLSYSLPSSLFKNIPVKGIRANMQARNLWWWAANKSDLDPEVWQGSSMSPNRGIHYPAEFILGLTVNF